MLSVAFWKISKLLKRYVFSILDLSQKIMEQLIVLNYVVAYLNKVNVQRNKF